MKDEWGGGGGIKTPQSEKKTNDSFTALIGSREGEMGGRGGEEHVNQKKRHKTVLRVGSGVGKGRWGGGGGTKEHVNQKKRHKTVLWVGAGVGKGRCGAGGGGVQHYTIFSRVVALVCRSIQSLRAEATHF